MSDPVFQTDGWLGCAIIVAFVIVGFMLGFAIGMVL
jgi:hypothetical protein